MVVAWPCLLLLLGHVYCFWFEVCIFNGYTCIMLLVGLCIIVGWPVYCCCLLVCIVVGWL